MFAYTSDRSNSSYPLIWFQRPGDSNWTVMTTGEEDGLVWNRTEAIPRAFRFRANAGNITSTIEYDDTNEVNMIFSESLLQSGNIGVTLDTLPRYRPYYWWNWRESTFGDRTVPETLPPVLHKMRGIMEYQPKAEMLCYTEHSTTSDISPRFMVSHNNTLSWYVWDGSTFQIASVASVTDLLTNGNTMFDLNGITEAEWDDFLPDALSTCSLMFTEEPPLALTSNKKVFSGITEAEYMLGTKAHIPANMRVERREI